MELTNDARIIAPQNEDRDMFYMKTKLYIYCSYLDSRSKRELI